MISSFLLQPACRCVALMRENQAAGRAFFYHLCRSRGQVADSDLARFAHVLGAYIAEADKQPEVDEDDLDTAVLEKGASCFCLPNAKNIPGAMLSFLQGE